MGVKPKGAAHLTNLYFISFLFAFAITPAVLGFYSFYNFLFTKFLKQKKILLLFVSGIIVSILCGIIGGFTMFFVVPKMSLFTEGLSSATWIIAIMSIIALLNGGMGLIIKGFITWYNEIKLKEELNQKNYETELALIKSQLNPHFLFNTINNIDVLIEMDAKKASVYLNKLSDIMRFMLYETKTAKIPLDKELQYIEKYISLQKIRSSNSNYVQYDVIGNTNGIMVEPMLFIPFIENAFKHAENNRTGSVVNINISIEADSITFECENKYNPNTSTEIEYGGLGNEIIKKRLQLLYPNKHILEIKKAGNIYSVKLFLQLHEN